MKYVKGTLEQNTATHTDCCIVWTDACMLEAPKDLFPFILVNCYTYKSVYVLTTIIFLNKFHVYEIVIFSKIVSSVIIMMYCKYIENLKGYLNKHCFTNKVIKSLGQKISALLTELTFLFPNVAR